MTYFGIRSRGIPLYLTSCRIVFISNAVRPMADYYDHFIFEEARNGGKSVGDGKINAILRAEICQPYIPH